MHASITSTALAMLRRTVCKTHPACANPERRKGALLPQNKTTARIMTNGHKTPKRVLAVASKGGHWEQLCLLLPAFDGAEITCVTTDAQLAQREGFARYYEVADYNQDEPLKVLKGCVELYRIVQRVRPDLAISTGAAPGLVAMLWARLLGARTVWVDSLANAEQLSLSGKLARRICHMVLSQWPDVAQANGVLFKGRVI